MATDEEPRGATEATKPAETVIKLPSPAPGDTKPALDAESPPEEEGVVEHDALLLRLDALLALAVLGFAFLSASFPVRNRDFLQNLGLGRMIAHGEYRFGAD